MTRARPEDMEIVMNLLQLYLHDYSEWDDGDVEADGSYAFPWLPEYQDPPYHAYLIRAGTQLAGFCLLDTLAVLDGTELCLSDFFILRKYRRSGIGRQAAHWLFKHYPLRWEISVLTVNQPANRFWNTVIAEYTGGRFTVHDLANEDWTGPVYTFDSRESV